MNQRKRGNDMKKKPHPWKTIPLITIMTTTKHPAAKTHDAIEKKDKRK
jgi:hypothetical protein